MRTSGKICLCADMKLGTSSEPAVAVTQSLPAEDQPSPEASRVDRECYLGGQRIVGKDETAPVIYGERKRVGKVS